MTLYSHVKTHPQSKWLLRSGHTSLRPPTYPLSPPPMARLTVSLPTPTPALTPMLSASRQLPYVHVNPLNTNSVPPSPSLSPQVTCPQPPTAGSPLRQGLEGARAPVDQGARGKWKQTGKVTEGSEREGRGRGPARRFYDRGLAHYAGSPFTRWLSATI